MAPITIAYTDLTGSTDLQRALHASDPNLPPDRPYIDKIQAPHRRRVRQLLQEYGGTEIDTMGDAFLVWFATAEKAALWAVAVQRIHQQDPIPTPFGALQVTIGLHTGEPERDPDNALDFAGLAMSYGARIASLCSPSQIVLSRATATDLVPVLPDHLSLYLHGEKFYAKGIGFIPAYELLYDSKAPKPLKQANVPLIRVPPGIRDTTRFVGREQDLQKLDRLLEGQGAVAVTAIAGLGGLGKTELAIQYARQYRQKYAGGVCWLSARTDDLVVQIRSVTKERFADFDLAGLQDLDPVGQVALCWRRWAKEDLVLAIVDDVLEYGRVKDFLPEDGAKFRVLLTTRLRLPNTARLDLGLLEPDRALALLTAIVGTERVEREPSAAAQICALMGYLPLALELIGQYLKEAEPLLKLGALVAELQQRGLRHAALEVDADDPTWASTAERGVAEAFRLSWDRLSAPSQELACLLGLFAAAPIRWEWVERAIGLRPDATTDFDSGYWRKARQRLLQYHLLEVNEKAETYQLHPLTRSFFASQRPANSTAMKRGFTDFMLSIAKQIPQTITQAQIPVLAPAIPHLDLLSRELLEDIADEDLVRAFAGVAWFYQGQGLYALAEDPYQRCLQTTSAKLGANHPSTASSLNNLAALYRSMGRYKEALPLFERALAIREQQLGANHPSTATSLNNLAGLYESMGRYEEALPLYERAIAIREQQLGANHPSTALGLNNLAALYRIIGRYEEALPLFERAIAIIEQQLGANHPDTATGLNNLAGVYESMGQYEEALPRYERALAIREQQLGANHPDTANSWFNLAALYHQTQRPAEALAAIERATAIYTQTLGTDHPDTKAALSWLKTIRAASTSSLHGLAQLNKSTENPEETLLLHERAIPVSEQRLGDNHPDTASSLNNLEGLYNSMGRYEEALPLFERALAIREQQLGANHPSTATSLNSLAVLYYSMGRYEEALPRYERAIAIREQQLGANHPDTANSWFNLAALYHQTQRPAEALAAIERATAIYTQTLGTDHPTTQTALNWLKTIRAASTSSLNNLSGLYYRSNKLAGLYQSMGRYKEALPLYERAIAIREQQLGANHPDTANSWFNLAALYHQTQRPAEALAAIQRATAIYTQTLGTNHPDTKAALSWLKRIRAASTSSLHGLAQLNKSTENPEETLLLHERAIPVSEQQLGDNHPDTASSLHNLAGLYYSMGRYEEALPLYERAIAIREQQLGASHPDTAISLHNLGLLYQSMGRYEEALPLYERSLRIGQQVYGDNHPEIATDLNNLAELYRSMGRYKEALPLFERALAIKEQQLGANHPNTAGNWFNLADLYRQTQRPAEALAAIERATAIYTQTLGTDHPTTQTALNWLKTIRSANTTNRKNLAGWQYTALVVFVLIFAVLLLVGLQIAFNTNWLPITLLIWLLRVLTRRLRL